MLAVLVYTVVSGLIFGGMWVLGYYLQPEVPDWLEQVVAPLLILAATFVLGYLTGSKFSHR